MKRSYEDAMHAMQAGVQMKMDMGIGKETEPKHLRVGINGAMSDHGALVSLLIKKGLFTDEEYFDAITEFANREADSYEEEISKRVGKKVTLV